MLKIFAQLNAYIFGVFGIKLGIFKSWQKRSLVALNGISEGATHATV